MPLNNINVGRDCTIDIFEPVSGGVVALSVITSFDAKQDHSRLKSKGMDGIVRIGVEPEGWSGKIMLDRGGPNLDRLFAILEAAYYRGVNIPGATMTQTIVEADQTLSTLRYIGVALGYDDSGNWANGKFIAQTLSWEASKRILVV